MAFIVNQAQLTKTKAGYEEEWVEYQPGVKFLIRGINHRIVQIGLQANREAQQQVYARYHAGDLKALAQGKTEQELSRDMLGELIVVDWTGIKLESGEDLPYTPESAAAVLSSDDEKHQALAMWVLAESARISREESERSESRLGKSLSNTAGRETGAARAKSKS